MLVLDQEENNSVNLLGRSRTINSRVGCVLVDYVVYRDKEVDGRYLERLKFNRITPSDLVGN